MNKFERKTSMKTVLPACPGKLFVVEGVDGAGKTTQLTLLQKWLESQGYAVNYTRRRTSKLVSKAIGTAKRNKTLSSVTYSLIHAADFADRQTRDVVPALNAGIIILSDQYTYTSFARDVVRGNDPQWVRKLYEFSIEPDAVIYLRVPVEVSLQRIMMSRPLEFYDAGQDIGLDPDPATSFKIFQARVIDEFNKMIREFGFFVVDGEKPIHDQQKVIRNYFKQFLAPVQSQT